MQRIAIPILLFTCLLLGVSPTHAQDAPVPDVPTPPRLSLAEGQVSFWRPGGEDWTPARANTPLAAGDSIYTGPGGNAEFQVGERAYVRIGESTQLQLSSIEPDFVQFKLTAGEASVDLRQLAPGHTVEVDTPNAAYSIEHVGYYRFNVDQQATILITRRGGNATLTPANGQAVRVNASEEIVAAGTETPTLETYAAPDLDSWDRWNYSRTDHLLDSMSVRYVPPSIYGAADLDHSGSWRSVPEYGAIWVPDAVAPGWAPYSAGQWIYDPVFGWTWVDDAPWGWAPYHYGRWVYVNGFWGWAPGPIVARPVYAPALVAWLGGVRITAGVGVGWVALGWGEPLVPWWGPRGFVGVPSWRGWGGPRVVNQTVINNTTVNVTNIKVQNFTYVNTQVHNAVIATSTEHFAHGGREFTHPAPEQLREVRPFERGIDLRPTAASLTPGVEHAARPQREVDERRVIAMHPARDATSWLHEQGLKAPEHAGPPSQLASTPSHAQSAEQPSPARMENASEVRARGSASAEMRNDIPNAEHEQPRPTPGAIQRQQGVTIPPTSPDRHVEGQPARQASNTSADHQATLERMRPPPPPSYSEWRTQQQGSKGPEARDSGAGHNAASVQPNTGAGTPSGQLTHTTNPGQPNTERRNLPGEPAMKLRPTNAATGQNRSREGGGVPCKEHDCR